MAPSTGNKWGKENVEQGSTMNGKILIVKHVSNEGPGLIQTFFDGQGWPVEIIDLSDGDVLPRNLDGIAAVVMLGGPMNVYEEREYPFLTSEDGFITKLLVEDIPFLGICLGAQLLVKACQGSVFKSDIEEIGWGTVDINQEGRQDPLFYGLQSPLTVFQWHGDTFDIPQGGTLLVQGKKCRNQAFKIGNCAYGLQFHIEVTHDMVNEWMKDRSESIEVKKIIKRSLERRNLIEKQAMMILTNFQRIVESSLRFERIIKQYVEDRTWEEKKAICWWETS